MSSKKPAARAKQMAAFKAQATSMDDLFGREERRRESMAARREEARYEKACASKNRYATRGEAEAAIIACAEHGRSGLSCYKCTYCGGWHLTSHPWHHEGGSAR